MDPEEAVEKVLNATKPLTKNELRQIMYEVRHAGYTEGYDDAYNEWGV